MHPPSRSWLVSAVFLFGLVGCWSDMGTIPVATLDRDIAGVKMIRPGVVARACRSGVIGIRSGSEPLEAAMRRILAVDPEGNAVTDVRVRTTSIRTGLYDRECVEVRGNLARLTPVVLLPAAGEHGAHH